MRTPIFSLQDFFHALIDSSVRPMTWIEGATSAAETAAIAPRLEKASAAVKALRENVQDLPATALLGRIEVMVDLAASTEWAMVTKDDWKNLTSENGPYQAGWVSLMSDTGGDPQRFTAAVEIMRLLNAIAEAYPSVSDGK